MLSGLHAAGSPRCLGGSSTCAGYAAIPDGDFVVIPKAHAYVKSKTANTIAFDLYRKTNIGFELVVFGQILPYKTGLSDLRSQNSQIQFRYTSNTMAIQDGVSPNKSHTRPALPPRPLLPTTVPPEKSTHGETVIRPTTAVGVMSRGKKNASKRALKTTQTT